MQPARRQADERKAKLNRSYQELLDEFSHKDLKTVGNYHLGRLIGKGSFGKVYLASHKLTNGSKACDDDTYTWVASWLTAAAARLGRAQVGKEG
jgi:serine/threonine protein kinase